MRFSAKRFLTGEFGTAPSVVGKLSQFGLHTPELATVQKWFQRDTVPAQWLPTLIVAVEMERGACRLSRYVSMEGADAAG